MAIVDCVITITGKTAETESPEMMKFRLLYNDYLFANGSK